MRSVISIATCAAVIAVLPVPCSGQFDTSDAAVAKNIGRLKSDSPKERHAAAHLLYWAIKTRHRPDDQLIIATVLPALEKQYREDKDQSVRQMSVQALAEATSPNVIPVLTECLKDQNEQVRRDAIRALARFGPQALGAVDAIKGGLENGTLASEAFYALAMIQGSAANDTIIPILKTRKFAWGEDEMVVAALGVHPDPRAVSFAEEQLFNGRGSAPVHAAVFFTALGNRSPETLRVMRKCLNYPTPSGDRQKPVRLTDTRRHNAETVRSVAVEYLASLKDVDSQEKIRKMLAKDDSIIVRTAAAKAMGTYRDSSSVPILFERLKEDDRGFESIGHVDGSLHEATVGALSRIGTSDALQAIYDGVLIEIEQHKRREARHEVSRPDQNCREFFSKTSEPAILKFFASAYDKKPLPGEVAAEILAPLLRSAGSGLQLKGDAAKKAASEFPKTVRDEVHFGPEGVRPTKDGRRVLAHYTIYSNSLAVVVFEDSSDSPIGGGSFTVVYKKIGDQWIPIGEAERVFS